MKNITTEKKNTLVASIIFLLLGIILFTNPGSILDFLSFIVGGALVLIGIINILSYRKTLKKLNKEDTSKLIGGIILIVLGLIVGFAISFIETTIRLVFGAWIIYSGIIKLIEVISSKKEKTIFYVSLTISILMIICGFYVAINTNLVFQMIGLFIMIYSILEIISYITKQKM